MQSSLFDDFAHPLPERAADLVIRVPSAGRRLSASEKAFNRALALVQTRRRAVDDERRRLDQALVHHAAEVRPRQDRAVALRTRIVRELAPFLDDKRLKASEQAIVADILQMQLDDVLASIADPEPELRAIFERVYGFGYDEAAQDELDMLRSGMAELFDELGVDIDVPDLRPDMSEADMAAATAELVEQLERHAPGAPPERPRNKQQMREDQRLQHAEQMRRDTLGAVYKRVVKVLHPDLEPDAATRERKVALMQEATGAYKANDLPTLLRLELEWVAGASADAARLGDDELRAYTELLKTQAKDLAEERAALRFHPRYMPLLVDGPFGEPEVLDGPAEVARLEMVLEVLETGVARLSSPHVLEEVRGAIAEWRRQHAPKRRRRRRRP